MRDAFCSYCGARYTDTRSYPRTCPACGVQVWANPLSVAVVLVPVRDGARTGLLVVRRAVPPGIGRLALVSGFLEDHESWQVGAAREVREETGVVIDPATLSPLWFTSTEPRPNRVLLFAQAAPIGVDAFPPHHADAETSERGLVFGPDGLETVFVYPFHVEIARRFFAAHAVTGPHAFASR
ncbi:MAG: NUDIX domain-containing protein [Deltaproteobacteria bacterium]|nr:NUDIX domain-containing protein [Deltaproteobacteria bacterium]